MQARTFHQKKRKICILQKRIAMAFRCECKECVICVHIKLQLIIESHSIGAAADNELGDLHNFSHKTWQTDTCTPHISFRFVLFIWKREQQTASVHQVSRSSIRRNEYFFVSFWLLLPQNNGRKTENVKRDEFQMREMYHIIKSQRSRLHECTNRLHLKHQRKLNF